MIVILIEYALHFLKAASKFFFIVMNFGEHEPGVVEGVIVLYRLEKVIFGLGQFLFVKSSLAFMYDAGPCRYRRAREHEQDGCYQHETRHMKCTLSNDLAEITPWWCFPADCQGRTLAVDQGRYWFAA